MQMRSSVQRAPLDNCYTPAWERLIARQRREKILAANAQSLFTRRMQALAHNGSLDPFKGVQHGSAFGPSQSASFGLDHKPPANLLPLSGGSPTWTKQNKNHSGQPDDLHGIIHHATCGRPGSVSPKSCAWIRGLAIQSASAWRAPSASVEVVSWELRPTHACANSHMHTLPCLQSLSEGVVQPVPAHESNPWSSIPQKCNKLVARLTPVC